MVLKFIFKKHKYTSCCDICLFSNEFSRGNINKHNTDVSDLFQRKFRVFK